MAWNQPGENQGGKPRGSARLPGGNNSWRRWRQRWLANPRQRAQVCAAAAGAAVLLWLASGFYQISDGERGVLQRFGAYAGLRASGAGWHLPWPIEKMTAVDLAKLNNTDLHSRMLTSDTMLINVTASIQYQYTDARAALFAVREPDTVVRELGEAVARDLIGRRPIAELMAGAARAQLTEAWRSAMQPPLDAIGAGVRVLGINLTDVQVPETVVASQRDLVQAGLERERVVREAQGYAAEQVSTAQGSAQRQRLEAEAYQLQTVGVAEGDAARFDPLVAAYARAPELLRTRLYIETIETILTRSRKLIIDGKGSGNTLVLPLDKLSDAGPLKAAGVTGIATAVAAPAAAAPAVPAAAPAVPAAPAPIAAPAPAAVPAAVTDAGDNSGREDRSRDRGERR